MRPESDHDSLDALWAATRPGDPSPEAFDALWARVLARHEAEPAVLRPPSWRRYGLALAAVAQAAALLVAAVHTLSRPNAAPPPRAIGRPAVVAHDYQVEEGTTLLVSLDGRGKVSDVVPLALNDESGTALADLDVLNFMESRSEEVP